MANLKQQLQQELDAMQMKYIAACPNIDAVKALISTFEKMNEVAQSAPDVSVAPVAGPGHGGSNVTGKKRGRRSKAEIEADKAAQE